jgi:hypothetical protein
MACTYPVRTSSFSYTKHSSTHPVTVLTPLTVSKIMTHAQEHHTQGEAVDAACAGASSDRCRVTPQAAAGLSTPGEAACAAPCGVPAWVLGAQGALLPATNQGRWGWWPLGCLHKPVQTPSRVTIFKGYAAAAIHAMLFLAHSIQRQGTWAGCACQCTC